MTTKTHEQIRNEAQISIARCGCKFDPWRRDDYQFGINGVRTLILGASTFYPKESNPAQFQREYDTEYQSSWFAAGMLEWLDCWWKSAYWTKWTEGFIGSSGSSMELRRDVLERVAFYNYFDEILCTNKEPPPEKAINAAPGKYRKVIAALQPEKVVVISGLVRRTYFDAVQSDSGEMDAFGFPIRRFTEEGHSYEAIFLPHPRTSYWVNDLCRAAISRLYQERR